MLRNPGNETEKKREKKNPSFINIENCFCILPLKMHLFPRPRMLCVISAGGGTTEQKKKTFHIATKSCCCWLNYCTQRVGEEAEGRKKNRARDTFLCWFMLRCFPFSAAFAVFNNSHQLLVLKTCYQSCIYALSLFWVIFFFSARPFDFRTQFFLSVVLFCQRKLRLSKLLFTQAGFRQKTRSH